MSQKIWKKGRHSKKVWERERHNENNTKAIARRLRSADAALKIIYVYPCIKNALVLKPSS